MSRLVGDGMLLNKLICASRETSERVDIATTSTSERGGRGGPSRRKRRSRC
jgi:hypothetical protein